MTIPSSPLALSSPGLGLDAIEIERVADAIARRGARFLDRIFTARERAYCDFQPRPAQHYAVRFAAKEAVLKLLRTGWAEGLAFSEVEIARSPSGAPSILLHGRAATLASRLHLASIEISLTHTRTLAMAVAMGRPISSLVGPPP